MTPVEDEEFPFYEIIKKDDADVLQYWITKNPHHLKLAGVDGSLLEFASHYVCPRVVKTLSLSV